MVWEPELADRAKRVELAKQLGGPEKVARQRAAGRLTVRERIEGLLDADSFREIGGLAGRGRYDANGELTDFSPVNLVIGTGRIDGRKIVVRADDFTVRGGSADAGNLAKTAYPEQLAHEMRHPLVRLIEGSGGGGSVKMLEDHGFTYVPVNPGWDHVVANLSTVPVVSACVGPVAGLGAALAVTSHLTILVENTAQLFVAGPPVVKYATGEDVTKEELGGAAVHRRSGAVDLVVGSESAAFETVRTFLSYLPSSVFQLPPVAESVDDPARREESLSSAVPRNRRQPYKLAPLLDGIFDVGSVFRYSGFGGSLVTALARLDGHPVGVVATDPYKGATLTAQGADALTRLADLCETFHLPLVSLTDQSGMVIGTAGEHSAAIRHGARAVAAIYQARVPMAEIIVRRVFGVGGAGQVNRHRLVRRWAWPSGDWGSLPVEGGLEAAYRAELDAAQDRDAERARILARLDAVRSPFRTAERFGVEDIIDPADSRALLCDWVRDAYDLLPPLSGPPSFGPRP
jgi:acetyl-CoA carboxylase carboxyltransferase component